MRGGEPRLTAESGCEEQTGCREAYGEPRGRLGMSSKHRAKLHCSCYQGRGSKSLDEGR